MKSEVAKKSVLILSVGGAKDSLRSSIENYKPDIIIALVSQATKDTALEIGAHHIFETENHEGLEPTYLKAKECLNKARDLGFDRENTIIDITSGTKIMSIALALAGTREQIPYSYNGGERNSSGTVISGSERIIQELNPDELFASSALKEAHRLNDQHEYSAAAELVWRAYERRETRVKPLLKAYNRAFKALHHWDSLRYKKARDELTRNEIDEALQGAEHEDASFLRQLIALRPTLDRLAQSEYASKERILDLIGNAERRARQGRYDDAVLRLYRVVEMVAQLRLSDYGIQADQVSLEKVPEKCHTFVEQADGRNSVDMFRSFQLLNCMGDEAGRFFLQKNKEFSEKIRKPRNRSVLAHGFDPLKEENYKAALDFLQESGWMKLKESTKFPLFA
jgi:CRISPR-associated protein (TIGR02710 family)